MTASKGESPSYTEKRKSWASIIKRTISFSHLSRNDKDNTNGNHPAASSSTALPAKSQSKLSFSSISSSKRGSLDQTALSSKRGSLDSTGSISSFNSSYSRRSSQTPPQEFWWWLPKPKKSPMCFFFYSFPTQHTVSVMGSVLTLKSCSTDYILIIDTSLVLEFMPCIHFCPKT